MAIKSIRDPDAQAEIAERLADLGPENERRWGVMDPDHLLPHLTDGLRLAMKGSDHRPTGLLATRPMRYLLIHRLKWPRGRAKASRPFERVCEDWDAERDEVLSLIDRYLATPRERLGARHPVFGSMKPRDWDVLIYRHLDHHLRQFGC
jgi:hypothetical protein